MVEEWVELLQTPRNVNSNKLIHPIGSWWNNEDIVLMFYRYVGFDHHSLDDSLKRVYNKIGGAQTSVSKFLRWIVGLSH